MGTSNSFFAFDHEFERASKATGIPLPLYRTLAFRESNMIPTKVNPKTLATGLFQLLPVVTSEWNRRVAGPKGLDVLDHESDLLCPTINTAVAGWLGTNILRVYEKNGLRPDFSDRDFVELFTFGFHAGHGGAGQAIGKVVSDGQRPTLDNVIAKAKELGSFGYAKNKPERLDRIAEFDRKTVDVFFRTKLDKPKGELHRVEMILDPLSGRYIPRRRRS